MTSTMTSRAPLLLARNQAPTRWAGIEESRYAIDVDRGIGQASNLAGNWMEEHGDEMQQLFDLSGLI